MSQENVFYYILERKKAFLGYKKKKFQKFEKFTFFPKGLIHGFGPKMDNYSAFFFQAIEARKMSFTIFKNEKRPFQAIKRRNSKSRKIDIFPKGLTHGFGLKMALFPTFIFYVIQARKMSFTIFQNKKKPFYAIKIRTSKSQKNLHFPKGVNPWLWSKNGPFFNFLFWAI